MRSTRRHVEKDIASLVDETQRSIVVDPRVERSLMNAAVRCGRSELAQKLFDVSPSDLAKDINRFRSCATERTLQARRRSSKLQGRVARS